MNLYFDLDTNSFVTAPGFRTAPKEPAFKRGDSSLVTLGFYQGGVQVAIAGLTDIRLGIKARGEYDEDLLVLAETADWTLPVDPALDYVVSPVFNTVPLNAALDALTEAYLKGMLEVTWSTDSGSTWRSTNTLNVRIDKDVIDDEENTPLELETPSDWLTARAVRYDVAQTLTGTDWKQARQNISAASAKMEELEILTSRALSVATDAERIITSNAHITLTIGDATPSNGGPKKLGRIGFMPGSSSSYTLPSGLFWFSNGIGTGEALVITEEMGTVIFQETSGGYVAPVPQTAKNITALDWTGQEAAMAANIGVSRLPTLFRKIAFLGDSITAGAWSGLGTSSIKRYQSFPTTTHALLGGAFDFVSSSNGGHFATGGYTLTQIINTWLPEVLASDADACVVLAGTNGSGETSSEKFAQWQSVIEALIDVGITPIACTTTPRIFVGEEAYNATLKVYNQLIRDYCRTNGIILCDWHNHILNFSDSRYADSAFLLSSDGVHPNITGGWRMGNVLAQTLVPHVQTISRFPEMGNPRWITANPYLTGNSSGKATGWNIYANGSGSGAGTKVARTDGHPGEMQQVAATGCTVNTDGISLNYVTLKSSGLYVEGETVKGLAELEFDSSGYECHSMGLEVSHSGSGNNASIFRGGLAELNALTRDIDFSALSGKRILLETDEFNIGTGTQINLDIYIQGNCTFRVIRAGVVRVL